MMDEAIAKKDAYWKEEVTEFDRKVKLWQKRISKNMKTFINWYWFSNEKTNSDKAMHMIEWFIATIGIITLINLAF